MKIAKTIVSVLLGIPFLVLGLNYFFNFLPMPPMEGKGGQFIGLLYSTGYLGVVKVLEVPLSLLLISGYLRPLALVLIAPIAVNILLFEIFMMGTPGIGVALVAMNGFLLFAYKEKYISIVK